VQHRQSAGHSDERHRALEILTDGASTLYGSNAIAGVVNFILNRNQQGSDIETNYNTPTTSRSGDSKYVSASYGISDLETKGFNVLAAYRHNDQSQIKSTERFRKNGLYSVQLPR
jgi:iron complex outermembrane receptor protein